MPGPDRFSANDGRQRRAFQRLSKGIYTFGDGLIFDEDSQTLSVDILTNGGLEFVGGELAVNAGLGIFLDASGVNVDLLTDGGLEFTGNELRVEIGDGIELVSGAVSVNLGTTSGLALTGGELFVDPGDGIELTAGGVAVNLLASGGLEFTGGELNIADPVPLATVGTSSVLTFSGTANGAGLLMATIAFAGRGPTAGTNADAIFCEASRKSTPAVRQTTAGLTTITSASGQVLRLLTAGNAGTLIGLNKGTVTLTGANSTIIGGADGFSTRTASGISSFIQGHAVLAGILTASGFASHVIGYAASGGQLTASGLASHVIGYAASGGQHLAGGTGSFAGGVELTGVNSADGIGSFVWGALNDCDASYAFCLGSGNEVSSIATGALARGYSASARHRAAMAHAGAAFSVPGDGQRNELVAYARTTSATPAAMSLDTASATPIILQDNSTVTFEIHIAAKEEAAGGERAAYLITGAIGRDAGVGTTAILGAPTVTVLFETTAALDANVSADTTNGALQIDVTGLAATDIRWVASVRLTEVVGA